MNETQEMLNIVGYSLSDKMVTDKIISWCIVHNEYNIDDINNFIYEKQINLILYKKRAFRKSILKALNFLN